MVQKSLEIDPLIQECANYDSETDFNGAIGIDLAERVYKKYGKLTIAEIIEEKSKWRVWKNIALRLNPPLLPGETVFVRDRLKELKDAGYDVKPGYYKLNAKETWNYFEKVIRDIISHVR